MGQISRVPHYLKCSVFNKSYESCKVIGIASTQETKQTTETVLEKDQALDLLDEDFKSAIFIMFKELEETTYKELEVGQRLIQ